MSFNLRTDITYNTYLKDFLSVCLPFLRKILEKVGYRRDRRGFTTPKAHVPITFRSFCLVLSCIYPLLVNPLDLIPPRSHIPAGSRGARGVTMLEYEDFCIEE